VLLYMSPAALPTEFELLVNSKFGEGWWPENHVIVGGRFTVRRPHDTLYSVASHDALMGCNECDRIRLVVLAIVGTRFDASFVVMVGPSEEISVRSLTPRMSMRNGHDRSLRSNVSRIVLRSNRNRVMTPVQVRASTRRLQVNDEVVPASGTEPDCSPWLYLAILIFHQIGRSACVHS
jgi:hypothetical protein